MKKTLIVFCAMIVTALAFTLNARAEYTDDCITFTSAKPFGLKTCNGQKNWDGTLWTSTDKTNWTEWDGTQVDADGGLDARYLYVRGDANNTVITGDNLIIGNKGIVGGRGWVFISSRGIACSGNIETLRGATGNDPSPTPMADSCYYNMFSGCASLTTAPTLPATTLSGSCYENMFEGCTALTTAPALPATTLAGSCYENMFEGCTSLTTAPALPATTLADWCYERMFSGCTALTTAPALSATTLANWCCYYMFEACTALTAAPALPATTLSVTCYANMFEGCTALTTAPALPATTLAGSCYASMFAGCTSLTAAPTLPATTLAEGCYRDMFSGCTSLVVNATAPGREWKIPATSTVGADWGSNMFKETSGTLQGQPELNVTYYIASAPPDPIVPGGKIVVPEGKAEEKAAEINADATVKAQYLKAPEGVETTADYLGCFDAVATSGSTVAFVLNEDGTNAVVEAAAAGNAAVLDTVFSESSTVTIAEPLEGFYYSLRQGGDVTIEKRADLNKLGGRDIISFELTKGPLQYFYQTLVTPTPVAAK